MIKSMTGFGRSELKSKQGHIKAEIKTSNHKFLEISSKLPNHLAEFEEGLRKIVSQELRRGKINLFISAPDFSVFSSRLILNETLAKEVSQNITRLKKVLKLNGAPAASASEEAMRLREVLHYPDVLVKDISSNRQGLFFKDLEKALRLALQKLKVSRAAEGKALENDLKKRLDEMKRSLRVIEKRIPLVAREYKKTLQGKIKEFLKNGEVSSDRLTQEVALFVKNADISEEVTRLKSHLQAMSRTLNESGELGRKIDFIAQEMYREANTMGAKSNDVTMANQVIQIKSAIEKIREQAQNVE